MVNHFRTLFLNEASEPDESFEQYVDSEFRPVVLTQSEAAVHNLIIRASFPRSYRNYLATLMTRFAYAHPISQLIDDIDSRHTFQNDVNQQASIQDRIILNKIKNCDSLNIIGSFKPDLNKGVFSNHWKLQYKSANEVLITTKGQVSQRIQTVVFENTTTSPYEIDTRAGIQFQFIAASQVPTGFSAEVTAICPMTFDSMAALNRLKSEDLVYRLFNDIPNGPELADVFEYSTRQDHMLSAILTAYTVSVSQRL